MAAMEQWLSALTTALPVLSALPVPPWAAAAGAALLLLLVTALVWLIGLGRFLRYTFSYGLMLAILGGGYYAFRQYEAMNQRRLLEDRAQNLFSQTIQPGTVFACIDGSPAPAMQEACERMLFAEPQRVATAVAITTQRIAYLIDATRFAHERDPGYLARLAPLRRTLENDPFGFVGFVLASTYRCMADLCDKFAIFDYAEQVKENIRLRRYEAYMIKYAGVWRGEPLPDEKKKSDVILPGVAVGDKPRNLIPLDAGPPALFDPVPRDNPIPSGPLLTPRTGAPAAATPPEVTPPPTVGSQPRGHAAPEEEKFTPVAAPAPRPRSRPSMPDTPFTPISIDPDDRKKAASKAEAPKGEEKEKAQKKSAAKGEPKDKGSIYRSRGNEPVAGLPRLVPSDYRRPDPNEPPDTPTPSGVLMSPNP